MGSLVKDTTTGMYVYRATTNIELFRMINPSSYLASYIYEDFDFDHCTGAYEFPAVDWGNRTSLMLTRSATIRVLMMMSGPLSLDESESILLPNLLPAQLWWYLSSCQTEVATVEGVTALACLGTSRNGGLGAWQAASGG